MSVSRIMGIFPLPEGEPASWAHELKVTIAIARIPDATIHCTFADMFFWFIV
jgi:hypothetical protein